MHSFPQTGRRYALCALSAISLYAVFKTDLQSCISRRHDALYAWQLTVQSQCKTATAITAAFGKATESSDTCSCLDGMGTPILWGWKGELLAGHHLSASHDALGIHSDKASAQQPLAQRGSAQHMNCLALLQAHAASIWWRQATVPRLHQQPHSGVNSERAQVQRP